jgi:general secretion pathway protein A
VPRVVNVLCDRALLAAWTEGRREVGARHVRRAVAELGPGREASAPARLRRWLLHPGWMAAVGVLVLAFGAWQLLGAGDALPDWLAGLRPPPAVSAPPPALEPARGGARDAAPGADGGSPGASGAETENTMPVPDGADAADPGADRGVAEPLDALLERLGARESEGLAAGALLSSWAVPAQEAPVASLAELDRALAGRDLRVQRLDGADLAMLSALNHPAVLRLEGPDGGRRAVALRHLDSQTAVLTGLGGDAATEVPTSQLETRWGGEAWIVWRDFVSLPAVIKEGHAGSAVYWLQRTLADLGFYEASPSGLYDDPTRSAVRAFQASRGLSADGRVGPHTKMALYDALGEFAFPRLRARGAG